MSILVTYATKHGSTREVAEAIAATLSSRGCAIDVRAAAEVSTVEPYAAVVLGGALYMGRWHRDARAFLARHRRALAARRVAVFGMGPLTPADKDVAASRRQVDRALAAAPEVRPASVAIFGGVIDPSRLRFPFSRMPASDARDWDAVEAWAALLAETVAADHPEEGRAPQLAAR